MDSYIKFEPGVPPRGYITEVWNVFSKSDDSLLGLLGLLGQIRWYAPWRRYCFFPSAGTIWSPGCLEDVKTFCLKQTEARKKERAEAKNG